MAVNLSYKKPNSANNKSHSCRRTKRQQKVNLQVVRLDDGSRVRLSAREKKTLMKYNNIAA
ncbi:MAG: 50S ribosomal protein L28 [Bacilli bacterium]|nr:50S ribosomal protein L28 [Bacilli bacterium]